MSQNQGWGQPPDQQGSGQQQPPPPSQQPPPGQQPPPSGGQPPQWSAAPPPTQQGWASKQCPACSSLIDANAIDCPRCGVRQPEVGYQNPNAVYQDPKSRPLAILLALLLGGFGIHRFYVGPVSWGIAYLIFFWTGIPGFLAWLEALYWLTRSDVEWAQKYGGPVRKSNGLAIGCLWIIALAGLIGIVIAGFAILFAIPLAFA